MNKRIIIVGPAAAGKDYLKKRFKLRGFKLDVSYTTREQRPGEYYDVDYVFISKEAFLQKIKTGKFYEYAKHGGHYYGTGKSEWNNRDVFILESDGISKITPEDRKNCFIIYLNVPETIRIKRLISERKWPMSQIEDRLRDDTEKFKNFTDYDIEITNENF